MEGEYGLYLEELDELDNRILNVLKENARLTYSEIGERVGVSRISVRSRMDALEKKGIIRGYTVMVDSAKALAGMHFILDLEVAPEYYEDLVERLAGSKYICQIYSVSGECAIHAVGYASNSNNIQIFANSLYREANKGIRRMSCKAVLSTIKDVDGGVEYERYQESKHLEAGDGAEG